jgi:hypothetical protein
LVDQIATDEETARTWANDHGLPYFLVSAYTGEGVLELIDAIARFLPKGPAVPATVEIEQTKVAEKSGCC